MTDKTKKTVLIVAGLAAVGGAIYYFTAHPGSSGGTTFDPTGNGNVTTPGVTPFNASKVANDLWQELKPWGFASIISGNGDQRDEIFRILAKVSQTQFGQVVKAFGKKGYSKNWGNDSFLLWETITYYDLPFILKNELEAKDYNTLRQKYPQYL